MRKIVITGFAAVGLGFALSSAASAAPVNAATLGVLATDQAMTVQYYNYGYYNGYRNYNYYRGYRSYGRYGYRYRRYY